MKELLLRPSSLSEATLSCSQIREGNSFLSTVTRRSPGVVPPVLAGAVHLEGRVAVAHVDADARLAVAEPRQPGPRQGLQPRRRPAQVQAVANVKQIPDRAVVQPVPARNVGGMALRRNSRKGSLKWALLK